MDIKQITAAILTGNFSNDELNTIFDSVKYARGRLGKEKKNQFIVGSSVKFRGRDGKTVQGTVVKIGIKNLQVRANFTTWRVPAAMLEPAIGIGELA
jgi:ribosomal protein L35AE/L33A